MLEHPGTGPLEPVRELGDLLQELIVGLNEKIGALETELHASARQDQEAARLMTIPGVGPITAMAMQAFAPPMESFRRGRDFSAWLGLVPRQHTTGGKPGLGKMSKRGQRDLRRLLITGAIEVIRQAVRRGGTADPLAGRDADAQAEDARRARTGRQNGAHHLAADDEGRENYRAPAAL